MEIAKLPVVLPTRRGWSARLLDACSDAWRAWRERPCGIRLDELDARTLADLGLGPSERGSVRAEARGEAERTRLRIVATGLHHG